MARMRALFAVVVSLVGTATAMGQLPARLERIVEGHRIPHQSVSVVVREIGGHEPVLAHLPDVPRNPASTIKLLTSWVALEVLGPTYTWPTEVYFVGDWNGRRLNGDLAIKGYGDPYLVTEEFWKLLGALRRTGLEEINGDLVIDDSFFDAPDGHPGDFDGQPYRTYNVPPAALLVNYKAVRFQFGADPNGRDVLISADPLPENLNIVNQLRLVEGPCRGYQAGISFDVRDPDTLGTVVFSGSFPRACAPYSLSRSVLQHDTFALGVFSTLWRGLGGSHRGAVRRAAVAEDAEPALIWRSRPLGEVIRSINKFSNNVMTRQLLFTLGAEGSGEPGTRQGGAAVIR
ncbi:MAG: D-alanyl-D-alanine carboxypeptidase/D-alanyl-D-alanine-endopeptidase, partial [Rhodospirillaceae bacterium]|nr:D-alanyl-D-alanine carboxypeptidase/D-alanyl-D-alanine-endopeptidase [Rhodospirillaceae bacterium]